MNSASLCLCQNIHIMHISSYSHCECNLMMCFDDVNQSCLSNYEFIILLFYTLYKTIWGFTNLAGFQVVKCMSIAQAFMEASFHITHTGYHNLLILYTLKIYRLIVWGDVMSLTMTHSSTQYVSYSMQSGILFILHYHLTLVYLR